MIKSLKNLIITVPLILAIISILFIIFRNNEESETYITGIVECTDVDVASKVPGRIDSILVSEGDYVKKGDIIAILESKEMDAKVLQVKSAVAAARSKFDMALNGARPEEKDALDKLYQQAKHQYELAEKTFNRLDRLYKDSLISIQERDFAEFQLKAATEQMYAAKAKYQMALNGARSEEISGAQALFNQSESALQEVSAYKDELFLRSPMSGEIAKKIVDQGEVIANGYPVFTIISLEDSWIVIQLREDKLNSIKMGSIYKAKVPALGNKEIQLKVNYISPLGEFANWKPTNQKGEFDLKTFEVHLKPVDKVDNLRPGMSVNIRL